MIVSSFRSFWLLWPTSILYSRLNQYTQCSHFSLPLCYIHFDRQLETLIYRPLPNGWERGRERKRVDISMRQFSPHSLSLPPTLDLFHYLVDDFVLSEYVSRLSCPWLSVSIGRFI